MTFSLKWMLAAVALVGFGCVALYNANEAWANIAGIIVAFVLCGATVGVVCSQSRGFFVGMCIFGWGYLVLNHVADTLVSTDGLLDSVRYPFRHEIPYELGIVIGEGVTARHSTGETFYVAPLPRHFRAVGHALFTLTFALTGGAVAQWFARRAKCDSP